ncbi:MAG: Mobile element protein [Ilumatobacteraceae bacterium]|nr:Mobile element protein [Ilumatobacteraceae bacterium]
MSHGNARLTFHGRCLLVRRVRDEGQCVAHVSKAMGVSRQCGSRWVARFDAEGEDGLYDRSSRPHTSPNRTSDETERRVLDARVEHRRGQDWLGPELGVAPRTVSRVLRRHDMPRLCELDPLTGDVIRSSKTTAVRYEREHPGDLAHMDVKKVGKIPDGGGWKAHGRGAGKTSAQKKARIGYDYVHSIVDDHSRYAYSEVLDNERAATCVGFLTRAIADFAAHGIVIDRLMTDNAWCYRHSNALKALLKEHDITHKFIKPHCPWQNGKVERFNRTLQTEWAYRHVFTTNAERTAALAPWIEIYNTRRRHSALQGLPPISRLSPT